MANISPYLNDIMSAVKGEEVRGSIHDAISAINTQVDNAVANQVIQLDQSLSIPGNYAAPAKTVGDRLAALEANAGSGGGGSGGSSSSYVPAPATNTTLGCVLADTWTEDYTLPVGAKNTGKLYAKPRGISVYYGSCTSPANAGSLQNKTVTCIDPQISSEDFSDGAFIINIYFQHAQTWTASGSATAITLNVNSTGAKQVLRYNGAYASAGAWKAGETVSFCYKGGTYTMLSGSSLRDGEGGSGGGGGSSELQVATYNRLGGVMPVTVNTTTMTQQVGVDSEGRLWTAPGTSGSGNTSNKFYFGTTMTDTTSTSRSYSNSGISSAIVNDLYINTSTWGVYRCTSGGSASNALWQYTGTIKGSNGITPTLSIGTVTTVSWLSQATVSIRGSNGNYILDFEIPQGEPGSSSGGSSSSGSGIMYATCATSASTGTKTATCSGFVLEDEAVILVNFVYAQSFITSSSNRVTLNVNNTGAKQVMLADNVYAPLGAWGAGEVKMLVYKGGNVDKWYIVGGNIPDGNGVTY